MGRLLIVNGRRIPLFDFEPSPSSGEAYRRDIDGLRAVAVLLVVFFHFFPNWLKGGFVGVDIFFVISGYLITGTIVKDIQRNGFSFSAFYARRVRRIFPALIFTLFLSCGLALAAVVLADELLALSRHMLAAAAFASNFLLWHEAGYFDSAAASKPLLHLWSLGVEEQFYLIWPFLMVVCRRAGWNMFRMAALLSGISFSANVIMVWNDPTGAFYAPWSRFWELLAGALLVIDETAPAFGARARFAWLHWRGFRPDSCKAAMGLSLIAVAVVCLKKHSAFPGFWAMLPTLGAVFIIGAGKTAWLNARVLQSGFFVHIGRISYPLYLVHWPVFVFAAYALGKVPTVSQKYLLILSSFLLAQAVYQIIERPIRSRKSTPKLIGGLVGGVVCMALMAAIIHVQDGMDFRYPARMRLLTAVNADVAGSWREGQCFLSPEQSAQDFSPVCRGAGGAGRTYLLWGDSHAAALYPGLNEIALRESVALSQYTASGCAPLLQNYSDLRPNCKQINSFVMELVAQLKPDVVLLHADWSAGDHYESLADTISAVRNAGVKRVVVIGSVPQWQDTLAHDLLAYWRQERATPPMYMSFRLLPNTAADEDRVEKIAEKAGAEFVPLYRWLCAGGACPTRTSESGNDIMSFDKAHLTIAGSRFAAEYVWRALSAVRR